MTAKYLGFASVLCLFGLCGCEVPNPETKVINTPAEPVPVSVVSSPGAATGSTGLQRVTVTNFPDRVEVKLPTFLHKDEVIQIITDDPNGVIGGVGSGAVLHIYYVIAVQGSWIEMMPKGGILNGLAKQWIKENAVWINVATFPAVYRDLGSG